MDFKVLKNIDKSFRQVRLFSIIFGVLCLAVTLYAVGSAWMFAEKQRQKIYVLDKGRSLMVALSQDVSINRPVEIREHVRRFHELFFTLAPDKDAIEGQMNRAFYLADRSAYNYYKDLAEQGYYNQIISGNIIQRVQIDSIICNYNQYPYEVTTYGKQEIIRSSSVTTRNLTTSCFVVTSVRSDNNPQGLMIEQFTVLNNQDIETRKR